MLRLLLCSAVLSFLMHPLVANEEDDFLDSIIDDKSDVTDDKSENTDDKKNIDDLIKKYIIYSSRINIILYDYVYNQEKLKFLRKAKRKEAREKTNLDSKEFTERCNKMREDLLLDEDPIDKLSQEAKKLLRKVKSEKKKLNDYLTKKNNELSQKEEILPSRSN